MLLGDFGVYSFGRWGAKEGVGLVKILVFLGSWDKFCLSSPENFLSGDSEWEGA